MTIRRELEEFSKELFRCQTEVAEYAVSSINLLNGRYLNTTHLENTVPNEERFGVREKTSGRTTQRTLPPWRRPISDPRGQITWAVV
jgi:hypothetical protein